MPWQYCFLGEHLGSLPTLQESFPISTDHGGNTAAQQVRLEKGCPAWPPSSSPRRRLPRDLHPFRAANCRSQTHDLHVFLWVRGAGRPFAKQRGGTQTRAGEGIEERAPHTHTSSLSRASRGKAILLQAWTLRPHPRGLPAQPQPGVGRRKIQLEGPTPPHHWPHIRHSSPFPKMHLLDETLSSPAP